MDGVILNIAVFDLVMVILMLCSDYSFTALRRLIATLNIICVGKDKRSVGVQQLITGAVP